MSKPYTIKTPILAKAGRVLDIVMNKGLAEAENDLSIANALKAASTAPRVVATDLRVRLAAPILRETEEAQKP
jgi:hypothetical protein